MQCALRWIFVRIPGVSHTLFWTDIAKSSERIRGRPYATCKRRVDGLERTWRANFAARDAQGGLRGNNNTDLARAMRALIAFRDQEEREKKEKEDDVKALEVRRRGLHELETERLGLTELCRYDTRVVTEDEEIGPEGIETNERQPADGDGSNPIPIDDEPIIEPLHQTEVDPLENLEPPRPHGQPSVADEIAPIVELLRKRRREEREESDIRREEQVLLNKRLAMMEEQVKMLSKLITQNNFPPATPCPQEDVDMNNSAEVTAEPGVEVETAATSESVHDIIVIDDAPAEDALEERADAPFDPVTSAKPTGFETDTQTADEVADVASISAQTHPLSLVRQQGQNIWMLANTFRVRPRAFLRTSPWMKAQNCPTSLLLSSRPQRRSALLKLGMVLRRSQTMPLMLAPLQTRMK